jgi:hypothetical protein
MNTANGGARARTLILREAIEVSAYDRVAGILMALLVMAGMLVGCLLLAWLSARVVYPTRPQVPKDYITQVSGAGISDGVLGAGMKFDSPSYQDVRQESDAAVPDLQTTMSALLESVSDSRTRLDEAVFTDADIEPKQPGAQQEGPGKVPGKGDGPGRPGIPPHQRWEIRFDEGTTIDEYARILDHFQIELGVVTRSQVIYVNHLAKPKPDTRGATLQREQRLYMSWRKGKMQEADYELLRRAGVARAGLVVQFYSHELEQQLLHLEVGYRGLNPEHVRKTRFAIKPAGDGYEFYVTGQTPL